MISSAHLFATEGFGYIFSHGDHPPLRGTVVSLTDESHLLDTRGSVPLHNTYPGMYVPSVLPLRIARAESSPAEPRPNS